MSSTNTQSIPSLDVRNISTNVLNTKYEVRGAVYLAAQERQKEGKQVIFTSVGNPQGLGQAPMTFVRQVLALVTAPFLLEDEEICSRFPSDAILRAKEYLSAVKSVGAYTDSRGSLLIRNQVANFLEKRDGLRCENMDRIFLTDGASVAVRLALQLCIRGNGFRDGILVPIPQYPLYSAAITLLGGVLVPYELDEDSEWGFDISSLKKAIQNAKNLQISCRGFVFINPGNPTGQQMKRGDIETVLALCHEENLAVMADEVYQENVYGDADPFISARSVLRDMKHEIRTQLQLLSFHTVSKGYFGECGLRGGFVEMINVPDNVVAQMYKLASINLCPGVIGQITVGLMVNPPVFGDPSYAQYQQERATVLDSLGRRAAAITDALSSLEGVACAPAGSMYAYPKITLSPKAILQAKISGLPPDVFYCLALLDATGIATTPGSGFGQKDGTFHFRTTILVPEDKLKQFSESIREFHEQFMDQYRGSPKLNKSRL